MNRQIHGGPLTQWAPLHYRLQWHTDLLRVFSCNSPFLATDFRALPTPTTGLEKKG